MSLTSLPPLKSMGVVGDALMHVYGLQTPFDYQDIVDRFNAVAPAVPQSQRGVLEIFSPIGKKTQEFMHEVSTHYSHPSINSAIDVILVGDSIPQEIFAAGIMSTRLNLPPQVYQALEKSYLPQWRELRLAAGLNGSGLSAGDVAYANAVHSASVRYSRALSRLEAALNKARCQI